MLYDLCLTLTAAASEDAIATVALRCDALGLEPLQPQPLRDPFTTDERKELEWYLETYWQWPYEQFAVRGQRVEQSLDVIGRRLYEAVFATPPAREIVTAWRLLPDAERRLSIIGNVPRALSLPWELLHDEQGFLALRTKSPVSIIRRLPQSALAALPAEFAPPLRVLLVTARPEGASFVDPRGIARELFTAVQDSVAAGTIALEFLRPPTRAKLRERLSEEPPIHILHFDGHGTFAESQPSANDYQLSGGAQGMLAFEHDDGTLDLAPAEELAQLMQDSGVRLAVLTACQSAKGAQDDLFSSVAALMIRSGIDAVAAMSASVLVVSAVKYVAAFYRRLATGEAVTLAHERARQALHDDPVRHRHQRRRDEAAQHIKLKDWWLPHFYLQRPLSFVVPPSSGMNSAAQPILPDSGTTNLPPAPRYGFTGRAHELHQIERWLLRGSAVALHGFGGTGKTALACETADWLTRTGMYSVTCFVSFEHGGGASMLLSELGNRLGINTGEYDTRDVAKALTQLRPALRQRAALIIADNLESILPSGEAQLDAAARAQLWDVLLQLSEMGAGIILTSRDHEFGDGRIAHGRAVKHLPLRGLHPEDALALAERLFEDLDIPKARAPYPKLRALLSQLDHHPLALQLVLPALSEDGMTIERLAAEFAALLPRFVDDEATGRNRSLMASLEYSLRRLPLLYREWLTRLAPFESGASEHALLLITEISEADWLRLRPALERVALITPQWVGRILTPFLHFHPVLTPYLRTLADADAPDLWSRYAALYVQVAVMLYHGDQDLALGVRDLAQLELANFRNALRLLLKQGALPEATKLAECLAWFLTFSGRWYERDEIRNLVEAASLPTPGHVSEKLTQIEYLQESGRGEDEFARGDWQLALTRFTALLKRIEAQPPDEPYGPSSYEHSRTLSQIARCLQINGQPKAAEQMLRRALKVLHSLLEAKPEHQAYDLQAAEVLNMLGASLATQGRFAEAQTSYDMAQKVVTQLGDTRGQAVLSGQLGTLAFQQGNYDLAQQHYSEALNLFQHLIDPFMEAAAWHQLGRVAEAREHWHEAEQQYRKSLEIKERIGQTAGVSMTCVQLAVIAERMGKGYDAEGWYKRSLNAADLPPAQEASVSSNLASLLTNEVRAGRMPHERLLEARPYAERALQLLTLPDAASEIWATQYLLADIAELEGHHTTARDFRFQAYQSFAAFTGNRDRVDQQFSNLLPLFAAAVRNEDAARQTMVGILPELEAADWHIQAALEHLYVGDHDWLEVIDGLDWNSALLVKRILESL